MSAHSVNPLLGDRAAAWRHARRYHPDDEADARVLADIEMRLSALRYVDTPVWLFDAERCQFLWANPGGLEIWRAESVREAQLRDIASSQSDAVYSLLNDYLEQVKEGKSPAVWVTLSPQGTLQRYYQSHHCFTLCDGRDCLLIEARAEPPAEALLSLASNHSLTLGLYRLDGTVFSGNPRFGDLSALNPKLESLVELLPPELRNTDWRETLKGTTEVQGSGLLLTERGERPFRWELRLLNQRQGEGRVIASFFDQTDQLVAEAEEARGALLEVSLDAILVIDGDGSIIEFNPAAEALFGYSRSEALGRKMADLIVPPELRERFVRGMARHQSGWESRILGRRLELSALRADGSRFLSELAVIEHVTGGRTQYIGFVRDVDALRRAEAQVRAERSRFSSVFEHAPDPIVILNAHREIVLANLACSTTLDWPLEELVGRPVDELLRPWQQEDAAHWGTHPSHELRTRGGAWIPVELRSNLFQLDGTHHSVLLLRGLQSQIKAAQDKERLAQQVKQSQRLKELGTLAGGVAHYFNNILAAMMGNLEVVQSLVSSEGELQTHVDELFAISLRGKEMVRRILAFSRKAPPGRAPMAVGPIAREAMKLVRLAYPPTIELSLSAEEGLPLVELNSSQIHQVLVNLITNACQAIGSEVGRVEIRIEAVELSRGDPGLELQAGRYLCIHVIDDGPGMDQETAAQAFHPFFTTKSVDDGTGLGLAEVHGIAAEHGGASVLDARPGEGCRVSVFLPALQQVEPGSAAVGERQKPAADGASLAGMRLLFLDDEEALCRVIPRLLRRLDVEVAVFSEPLAALAHFRSAPQGFDVVMSDISMPQMSGFQFARGVSALNAEVPILLASGRDLADLHELGVSNPIAAIEKPYVVQQLAQLLGELWTPA